MINSELQMLSRGAGYETQVALYLLLLEIELVLLVLHPDLGRLRSELMYVQVTSKQSQP